MVEECEREALKPTQYKWSPELKRLQRKTTFQG